MVTKKILRTCNKGHQFYKSSDCPICPICEEERKPKDNFLSLLAAPARRALENNGITTLEQLSNYSEKEILNFHGIGKSTIPILQKLLTENKRETNYIQTLHPVSGKVNKKILVEKYDFIKENLLNILVENELTHTELMEELYTRVNENFEGGVQWYGETVKLDLEARKIIERTKTKPEIYKLSTTKH